MDSWTIQRVLFFGVLVLAKQTLQESVTICEKEDETLTCKEGVINVTQSTYGRTNLLTCGISLRRCRPTDVMDIIAGLCNGKAQCEIKPDNRLFKNYCRRAYLTVKYDCVQKEASTPIPTTRITKPAITTIKKITQSSTTKASRKTTTDIISVSITDDDKISGSTLTEINFSGFEFIDEQQESSDLGNATGPAIGLASAVVLIIVLVAISLGLKRRRRLLERRESFSTSSFLNKTYDTTMFKPKNNTNKKVLNSEREKKKYLNEANDRYPSYENIPKEMPRTDCMDRNNQSLCSGYSIPKTVASNKCPREVALDHESKMNACSVQKQQRKRSNDYVYTTVKNKTKTDTDVNNDYDVPKKIPLPNDKSRRGDGTDDLTCDSYYLDMSVKGGKSKDIDIKYMTMNRTANSSDELSVHLHVNDKSRNNYYNIQIENKDKSSELVNAEKKHADGNYENCPKLMKLSDAVEDSVYEPYNVKP